MIERVRRGLADGRGRGVRSAPARAPRWCRRPRWPRTARQTAARHLGLSRRRSSSETDGRPGGDQPRVAVDRDARGVRAALDDLARASPPAARPSRGCSAGSRRWSPTIPHMRDSSRERGQKVVGRAPRGRPCVPVEELLALEVGEVPATPGAGRVQRAADHRVVRRARRPRAAASAAARGRLPPAPGSPGSRSRSMPSRPAASAAASGEVGVGGAVAAAQLDAVAVGDPDEVGAVVAAVGGLPGRPGGARAAWRWRRCACRS